MNVSTYKTINYEKGKIEIIDEENKRTKSYIPPMCLHLNHILFCRKLALELNNK